MGGIVEGIIMNSISKEQHNELIKILNELIETIVIMRKEENEISNRFFCKYDVQIGDSELDNRRAELMKIYISKSNKFLK